MLRIVVEFRYDLLGKVLDRKGALLDSLNAHFGDKMSKFRVKEDSIHCVFEKRQCVISTKNAVFMSESLTSYEEEKKFAGKLLRTLSKELELEKYTRVGVRLWCVWSVQKLESLTQFLSEKFYKEHDSLFSIFKGDIVDVGFPVDMSEIVKDLGKVKSNLVFGPMSDKQLREILNRKGDFPKASVYADFDQRLVESVSLSEEVVKDFLTHAGSRLTLLDAFIKQLLSDGGAQ